MKVAVLAGGRSSEHEVSRASAQAVMAGLEAAGHEPIAIDISRDGRWSQGGKPVALDPGCGLLDADVVFPVLHGPFGEDGTVQGLLELADVPYVGAGVLASAVCMDKSTFKDLMAHAGISQVDYVVVRRGDAQDEVEQLGLPVFVKPARMGSSVGISRVDSPGELGPALETAFSHDSVAVCETMARGREIECSVLGNADPIASEPGEIEIHGEWYDYEAKYAAGGMELVVPARIAADLRDRVRALAVEVFRRVGCRGLARVDFFVEDEGKVFVNELNTMPGFTETSVFAKLFAASGLEYPQLVNRLLELAIEHYEAAQRYRY